ncbi:UDP-glucuronic acid/UDP-N-acetylgalactosamine transporter [Phytophthora nicotianae]|uniref:UDP-glucuronic acid/UDP-N-acetylgalactosamine transporter n=1 Tax=Phytophthora nicotianae TaxID=4792 RepID=A0A0W8BV25_PHYNI|nr:UDP-glucuronic acid/UDP-N-acetylgalactosamine transporter [Phytophthora nicotianae]
MKKASPRSSNLAIIVALCPCLFYFMCSLAMNLLTKTLVTTFQWRFVYTLGAVQSIFTLASLSLLSTMQRVHAVAIGAKQHINVNSVEMKHRGFIYVLRVLLPLMALHLSNMLLGFASLQVLGSTSIDDDYGLADRVACAGQVSSAGSLIAGSTDAMSAGCEGYALVLLQNLCTAMSLALSKESALTPRQLVILNSLAGAVCCSVLGFIFERDEVLEFPHLSDPRFIAGMMIMCSMCVLYQFSVQFCTLYTSALTTSVTGNIKDLFATVGGYLLFPDAPTQFANFVGVALSFIGAYSFSYIRYRALVGPSPHQKQL